VTVITGANCLITSTISDNFRDCPSSDKNGE